MSDTYSKLSQINVTSLIDMKNGYGYLSWPFAVHQLKSVDPLATWEVKRFKNGDGVEVPYLKTELGYFVEVSVTCGGVTQSQIHPVLDEVNEPIETPTTFDINTSTQRCLVKAIALHGLGLHIYAGEDLPLDEALKRLEEEALKKKEEGGDQSDKPNDAAGKKPISSKLIQAIATINKATPENLGKAEKIAGQMFEGKELETYLKAIADRKEALKAEIEQPDAVESPL